VQYGLATGYADSAQALAEQRGLEVVATFQTTLGDQIVQVLGSWPVRLLLLVVFLGAANVVIHAPGHGVAEVIGLAALLLMLGVPLLTGYAQWWEILVIFLGLALVAVEILLPGHFVPGITGACLVLFGLVMTFVPKEPGGAPGVWPDMNSTWLALERGLAVVAAGLGCSVLLWLWMNRYLPKIPYFRRLILTNVSGGGRVDSEGAPLEGKKSVAPPAPAGWPEIGSVGLAVTELKPGGKAEFYDQAIADRRVTSVISESGFVPQGSKIIVRAVGDNSVFVRPVQA
jgi:membrane-bound serine protease (ClpP class)